MLHLNLQVYVTSSECVTRKGLLMHITVYDSAYFWVYLLNAKFYT